MATTKLKNIKAVNEMLLGTHRTQTKTTVGFSDTNASVERNKKREVGETWEEKNASGNIEYVTQKEGYRIRSNVNPEMMAFYEAIREELKSFPNCQKEGGCTCKAPSNLDEKFRKIVGMCHDCLVTYETRLKMRGEFNEYALDKMKQNAESFFKQADVEVGLIKESLKEISFVNNEHGEVEKWEFDNSEATMQRIDEHYKKFKENTLNKFVTEK